MGLARAALDATLDARREVCPACAGPIPKGSDCCNGCWLRFEDLLYVPEFKDAEEAQVWHAAGPRVSAPLDIREGQAWLHEPAPGEQSVWVVRSVEQDGLGTLVRMRRHFPQLGDSGEWYGRAMLEDSDWTFLRHPYPPPPGLLPEEVKKDQAAPTPPAGKLLLEDCLWERDPADPEHNWGRAVYKAGQVWKVTKTGCESENLKVGMLVRVVDVGAPPSERINVVDAEGKPTQDRGHGFAMAFYCTLMRPRRAIFRGVEYQVSADSSKTETGQVWLLGNRPVVIGRRTTADGALCPMWEVLQEDGTPYNENGWGQCAFNVADRLLPVPVVDAPEPGKRVLRWRAGEVRRGPIFIPTSRNNGVGAYNCQFGALVDYKVVAPVTGSDYDWTVQDLSATDRTWFACEDWPSLLVDDPEKWVENEMRAVYLTPDMISRYGLPKETPANTVIVGMVTAGQCLELRDGRHLCLRSREVPSALAVEQS